MRSGGVCSRPAISPKKTIEGAVGGFVFGGVFLALAGRWWLPDAPMLLRAALGVAVVAAGIVGDLFESMLKRSAGVKDSSTLIPGHGGILDRIDALLFAAPIYYSVLKYYEPRTQRRAQDAEAQSAEDEANRHSRVHRIDRSECARRC